MTAIAAYGPSVAPPGELAFNVRLRAMNSVSQKTALSSKEGLGQLQLFAIDRFGAVNGCIAAKPSPRH